MTSETPYVIDLMTPVPVVVSPTTTASAAERLAVERGVHHLLVVDGYQLAGLVCLCDLRLASTTAPVSSFMRPRPVTVDDQETAEGAARLMQQQGVGCLPVVDWAGTLRGVITRRDLRGFGLPERADSDRCASCKATHGLRRRGGVLFCALCMEQARMPKSPVDEAYFTLGGGD